MQSKTIEITTRPTYITTASGKKIFIREVDQEPEDKLPDDFYPWLAKVFALALLAETIMLLILMQTL